MYASQAKSHLPFSTRSTFISSMAPQAFARTVLADRRLLRVPSLANLLLPVGVGSGG